MPEEPKPEAGVRKDQDPKEEKLKLRAKEYIIVDGVTHKPGEIFELPERQALGLVGEGQAEQIAAGQPAEPATGTSEQVAEETHAEKPPKKKK